MAVRNHAKRHDRRGRPFGIVQGCPIQSGLAVGDLLWGCYDFRFYRSVDLAQETAHCCSGSGLQMPF